MKIKKSICSELPKNYMFSKNDVQGFRGYSRLACQHVPKIGITFATIFHYQHRTKSLYHFCLL